jgi:flagellar basal body rod protein FlgG
MKERSWMTRMLRSDSWKLLTACASLVAGCTTVPPVAGPAQGEQAALEQLERSSETAGNAARAINQARAVVANNLKNAHAVAFKSSSAILQEGGRIHVHRDFSQGDLEATSRPLDLAIKGEGFFHVMLGKQASSDDGYTRQGSFILNAEGQLCLDADRDYRLNPVITVPMNATTITILSDGRVIAEVPGNTGPQTIGQIQIARFVNPDGLQSRNDGIFLAWEESGRPVLANPATNGNGLLQQGSLESSNVDVARETVRLADLDRWRDSLMPAMSGRQR